MVTQYKLYYFPIAGAAEPIRYVFAYADQKYEDIRIKREDWPEFKKTTPFGKVPFLEVDGKATPQSGAILRYLAKKFNLTGDSEDVAFQADSLYETLKDLQQLVGSAYFEKDPTKKEELKKKLLNEDFPFYYKKFDEIIAKNGGLLAGKKITYADLAFAASLSRHNEAFPGILKQFPSLNGLIEKINNLPAIKKWIQTRPKDV